jgi:hypothetical protein
MFTVEGRIYRCLQCMFISVNLKISQNYLNLCPTVLKGYVFLFVLIKKTWNKPWQPYRPKHVVIRKLFKMQQFSQKSLTVSVACKMVHQWHSLHWKLRVFFHVRNKKDLLGVCRSSLCRKQFSRCAFLLQIFTITAVLSQQNYKVTVL